MGTKQLMMALGLVAASYAYSVPVQAAEWTPGVFAQAETIDMRTIAADEGEYWFPVWVVVIDDQVFVRLGTKAAERMRANQAGSEIGVRVGDRQFDKVRTEEAPEYIDRVAAAMGAKYWSDIFIRYFAHPMTLRLVVDTAGAGE